MLTALLRTFTAQLDRPRPLSLIFSNLGSGAEMASRFLTGKGYSVYWESSAIEHISANVSGARAQELRDEFCSRFAFKPDKHGRLLRAEPTFSIKTKSAVMPTDFWNNTSHNSLVYIAYRNALGRHLVDRRWKIKECRYVLGPYIDQKFHYGECTDGSILFQDNSGGFHEWFFVQSNLSRKLDWESSAFHLDTEPKPTEDLPNNQDTDMGIFHS